MVVTKSHKDLKAVLLNPKAPGVKDAYFIIRLKDQAIIIVAPGKNGVEFNKTMGYFHKYQGVEIHQCLYGKGVMILQRNDDKEEAKEFKVITLNPGRQVEVPIGWGHCLINIGKNSLVVINNSLNDIKAQNSKPIIEKKGFAYYIIEKKGEISFEQNPNYSVHPQITTE